MKKLILITATTLLLISACGTSPQDKAESYLKQDQVKVDQLNQKTSGLGTLQNFDGPNNNTPTTTPIE